jgi:hypothetical protein
MSHRKEHSPPATKADIAMLMDSLAKMYDANERWKQETIRETSDKFEITVDAIRRDLPPAKSDQIEVLRDRVHRLEVRAGIAGS